MSILDYQSTQLRLLPLLATCYGLHFARGLLVDKYVDMKRTKDPKLVEEVGVAGEGGRGQAVTMRSEWVIGAAAPALDSTVCAPQPCRRV